jgi:addiction module HigA family antidote
LCDVESRSLQSESAIKKRKKRKPVHPGEVLSEDFMKPYRLSMNKLALDLRVPVTRIADIVAERRGISPDTALRLGRYFKTAPRFWLNLQTRYDLEMAEDEHLAKIERDVRPIEMTGR